MESPRIYLSPPYVDQKEEDAVVLALRSGWVAPVGPNIDSFESALKNKFRYKHVLALNSGTAALHLAIKLSGVTKGDKVIIGTFTFVAAANVVLYEGGEPIFIDSEPDTWNLDPELLEERLKKGREQRESIKAVIVTHLYGMPAKMARIKKICEQFGVKLIEDAAEAVGSKIEENFVGSFGDFGILSFNGNKIVTTSGGGALICHQESDDSKARFWAQQSKDRATHYQHSEVGYNYRLSNILASIGITQLERLDDFINRKKVISAEYKSALEFFDFLEEPSAHHSNHWLSTGIISEPMRGLITPNDLIQKLEEENIEARPLWKPLHLQPLFRKYEYVGEDVAENLFNYGICLPSGIGLSDPDQHKVIAAIKKLLTSRSFLK